MSEKSLKYYFDYAATTPLDPKVQKAMRPYCHGCFGNPSSPHRFGRQAKAALESAKRQIAAILSCSMPELVFTASATESNNLAVLGIAHANRRYGKRIIISQLEHASVESAARTLEKEGFEIVKPEVDKNGLIHPKALAEKLDKQTILVSLTHADSETGTIQPIAECAKIIRDFRRKKGLTRPFFHTDAAQAASYSDINVQKLGVDLMTISAHKIYGPKGVGGLFIRKGALIAPLIFGGGQEGNLRSGTENILAIAGFAEALSLAAKNQQKESLRLKKLRDKLEKGIFRLISKVILNGHPAQRLPHFLNISVLDIEGEAALLYLDQKGIAVSTGSACHSQSLEPSPIIAALGRPYEYIHGSLRFSLGKYTTNESVDYVLRHLPPIVAKLRRISPLNLPPDQSSSNQPALAKAFIGNQIPHFLRKKK